MDNILKFLAIIITTLLIPFGSLFADACTDWARQASKIANLGNQAFDKGDYGLAAYYYEEAGGLFRQIIARGRCG